MNLLKQPFIINHPKHCMDSEKCSNFQGVQQQARDMHSPQKHFFLWFCTFEYHMRDMVKLALKLKHPSSYKSSCFLHVQCVDWSALGLKNRLFVHSMKTTRIPSLIRTQCWQYCSVLFVFLTWPKIKHPIWCFILQIFCGSTHDALRQPLSLAERLSEGQRGQSKATSSLLALAFGFFSRC